MSVQQFSPTWPIVRCTRCHYLYEMPTSKREGIVTGDCPRCRCETFDTTIDTNEASS